MLDLRQTTAVVAPSMQHLAMTVGFLPVAAAVLADPYRAHSPRCAEAPKKPRKRAAGVGLIPLPLGAACGVLECGGHCGLSANDRHSHAGQVALEYKTDALPALAGACFWATISSCSNSR